MQLCVGVLPYEKTLKAMEDRVAGIREGTQQEVVWILQHEAVYTYTARSTFTQGPGKPLALPWVMTSRGGLSTYHGPGQLVVYPLLRLTPRGLSLGAYVTCLEHWIIRVLARLGVTGHTRPGARGVWVEGSAGVQKIASLGVRLQGGVVSHGFALNVTTDVQAFQVMEPCGLSPDLMTSLEALGWGESLENVATLLMHDNPFPQVDVVVLS